nr:cell division cycle protein 27 homolog B isoform X2 [Ipomoea batatas]
MEAILVDSVQSSLRHFMCRNAIFMCERLCAEFPSETNMQLLAACYLQNNQAYAAYHILKGTQMAQSRYLFALSCFQMDLLNEAEMALSQTNDPTSEVPNGAAGHYLLGLIYRYTDRKKSAVHHFNQALSLDPLLWAAYEELCILGLCALYIYSLFFFFFEKYIYSLLKCFPWKH